MPINLSLMRNLQKEYGKEKGTRIYHQMRVKGKVKGEKPRKKVQVKSYTRKKHGTAKFGGKVCSHSKSGRVKVTSYGTYFSKCGVCKKTTSLPYKLSDGTRACKKCNRALDNAFKEGGLEEYTKVWQSLGRKSGRASIDEMNAVRAKNALSKFTRYDGKVMSWKELVDNYGVKASESEVPSIAFNRTKFNRMDNREQEEYEAKMAITKPDYQIYVSDNSFISVPKFVYMYAKEIGL